MDFSLVPMDGPTAERIAEWRYDPPYDFYDLDADPGDREAFLDPTNWEHTCAVADGEGTLVGYFTFEPDGEAVDIGLGMHPGWTGRGFGAAFVAAGLAFAREEYGDGRVELAVATFNRRAIRVYERAGFEPVERFQRRTNGGEYEFLRMRRA